MCCILVAMLALGVAGCHAMPRIESISLDDNDVQPGVPVVLRYRVAGATSLRLDPGAIALDPASQAAELVPRQTVTLTLTAARKSLLGPLHASAQITLRVVPHAPVPRFWADPADAQPGAAVTLRWDAGAATGVTLSSDAGPLGDHPAAGSLVIHPAQSALYTLQAHSAKDPQPAPLPVRVRVAPPLSVQLTADQTTVTAGAAVQLRWTSTGATGHALDNGIGYLAGATSFTVRPQATTTYRVTAYGPASGTATDQVTVTVSGPAPGQRALVYVDPIAASGSTPLELVRDASSTGQVMVLRLVTTQAVTAAGLALDLPLDATRVQLDAAQPGDVTPGLSIAAGALDPGSSPAAAGAAIGSGRLLNTLAVGVAQKATSPGVVPQALLPAGTELLRLRLVPASGAQPGLVFDGSGARAYFGPLPRVPGSQASVAIGTLSLQ